MPMTTVVGRSVELGRRAHRTALWQFELDAAERSEARVDGAAEVFRRRYLADSAAQDVAGLLLHRAAKKSTQNTLPRVVSRPSP
ncbi:MAG: hypothetical protein OXC65_08140 [Thiotrichales bacterium]|nr:hypothetical protein [Thiotrichales bacterium]